MAKVIPGSRGGTFVETSVKLATWNIWWRFGDWQKREAAILGALQAEDADIIALQEVWRDGEESQASILAQELGLHLTYEPVLQIDGNDWGMAILSRWPIVGRHGLALPSMPSEDGSRNCRAMMAMIEGPRGRLAIFNTHLTWRPEEGALRQSQVAALCHFVTEHRGEALPPVVCGDFNAIPSSDEIRMMTGEAAVPVEGLFFYDAWRAAGHTGAGFTWDSINPWTEIALQPNRRLDYIFAADPTPTGQGHVRSCGIFGDSAVDGAFPSDHYGVQAVLRY